MTVIPAGFGVATLVFGVTGVAKPLSWSIGYQPDVTDLANPSPNAAGIRDAFSAAGGPYVADQMLVGYTFQGVTVAEETATGQTVGASLAPVNGTLAAGAGSVPINCALLMTKYTARGGRRGKGRAFLPPSMVSEDRVEPSGLIIWSGFEAWTAKLTAAFTTMKTNGFTPMLLHGPHLDPATGLPDPPGNVGPPPDEVLSISLSTLLATQRRRMR